MFSYHTTLNQIIDKALPALRQLNEAELSQRPAPGKWSKKEILGHLIDSAYNNHQRFLRAEKQGNLIFQGYDQRDWVEKNDYQNRALGEVLDTWATANRHLSVLIAGLSGELLQQESRDHNFHLICMNLLSEGELTSLSYLIWDYLFHLEHHLAQLIPGYVKVNASF
jgi:hypothetical protein